MTKFSNDLERVGLSVKEFCELTGTPLQTAYNWKRGVRRTPGIALFVLSFLLGGAIFTEESHSEKL